jgi:hypothetical protein
LKQLADFEYWIRICLKSDIYIHPDKLTKMRIRMDFSNSSSDSPENRRRNALEFFTVFSVLKNIASKEDMLKIFPDSRKYILGEEPILQYCLGRSLFESQIGAVKAYGLILIYEILQDENLRIKCEKNHGFKISDFNTLCGNSDLFGVDFPDLIHERDGRIAGLEGAVTERDGRIAGLEGAVSERDGRIAGLEGAVNERDGRIAGLEGAVSERDGRIAGLEGAVNERDGRIAGLEGAVSDLKTERSTLSSDNTSLATSNSLLATERDALSARLSALGAEHSSLATSNSLLVAERDDLATRHQQLATEREALSTDLSQRFQEIALLGKRLLEVEAESDQWVAALQARMDAMQARITWKLGAPARFVWDKTRNTALKIYRLPTAWRILRLHRSSGLFNHEWYYRQNPDVKATTARPFLHFAFHGVFEGRSPNPSYNESAYLRHTPSAQSSSMKPLLHYTLKGWKGKSS